MKISALQLTPLCLCKRQLSSALTTFRIQGLQTSLCPQAEEGLLQGPRVGAVPVVGPTRGQSTAAAPPSGEASPAVAAPMRRSASEDALAGPRAPPAAADAAEPPVGRDAPPPPRGIWAPPLSAAVLEARRRVQGGRQMRRVASEAELAERRREEALTLTQGDEMQARRMSNQYASTSAEPAESGTASEQDRPLLKYLEERPRVNVMESLRLLEATLNMLAPSHQREEPFKQVCAALPFRLSLPICTVMGALTCDEPFYVKLPVAVCF